MKGYVKSSPHFFRPVKIAMALCVACLLIAAAFVPAPLQEAADAGRVPNPVKSAWFLLWLQEIVSYSTYLIYPVILLALFFLFLPWMPGRGYVKEAEWLPKRERMVTGITIGSYAAIVVLTVVALFFRGNNWSLVVPF